VIPRPDPMFSHLAAEPAKRLAALLNRLNTEITADGDDMMATASMWARRAGMLEAWLGFLLDDIAKQTPRALSDDEFLVRRFEVNLPTSLALAIAEVDARDELVAVYVGGQDILGDLSSDAMYGGLYRGVQRQVDEHLRRERDRQEAEAAA
jgi:hypothetical protein